MAFSKIYPDMDGVEIDIGKLTPFANYPLENFKGRRFDDILDQIRPRNLVKVIRTRRSRRSKLAIEKRPSTRTCQANRERQLGKVCKSSDACLTNIDRLNRSKVCKVVKKHKISLAKEAKRLMRHMPIIVRASHDGMYEILDGHYRVAAFKNMKIKTIPAEIRNNLAEDEVLYYISDISPLGLKVKHNVDIFDYDYKNSESYKKIEDYRVDLGDGDDYSMAEYIERFLLTKDEVLDTYESIYEMGNSCKIEADESTYRDVAEEILARIKLPRRIKNKKSYVDIASDSVEFSNEFQDDGGIFDRLKTHIGFEIKAFDEGNDEHKAGICKIIYFVYLLENKIIPEMFGGGTKYYNVLEFLSKPTMESIDNSYHGQKTFNGKLTALVKNPLERELCLNLKRNIKNAVKEIATTWDSFLNTTYERFMFFRQLGYESNLDDIINLLGSEDYYVSNFCPGVPGNPIEILYLKVVQSEYIGNITDIAIISKASQEVNQCLSQEQIDEMRKLHFSVFDINCLEGYINKNASRLAKYVFLNQEITNKNIDKIKYHGDKVRTWLEFCIRAKPRLKLDEIANDLQLVSFLQAFLLEKQSETFNYTFYGYQKHMKHMTKKHAVFKTRSNNAVDALQVYWVRRVVDYWYANVGMNDIRMKIRELQSICDSILLSILKMPTLEHMRAAHGFYYDRLI